MLTIEETCFARSIPEPQLLLKYGFTADDGKYEYSRKFMDDLFLARIIISFGKKKDFVIKGQIIDLDNDEEYLPVRSRGGGSFTCKVRNEYIKLLEDIRSRCFRSNYYSLEQANLITAYIEGELGKKIEFPWLKAPDAGIFRCANNKENGILNALTKLYNEKRNMSDRYGRGLFGESFNKKTTEEIEVLQIIINQIKTKEREIVVSFAQDRFDMIKEILGIFSNTEGDLYIPDRLPVDELRFEIKSSKKENTSITLFKVKFLPSFLKKFTQSSESFK